MAGRGYLRYVTAIFLLSSIVCHAAQAAEHKRVMLLHSFGSDFMPWSEYAKAIRVDLNRQSPWPLDFIDHSLVTARSGDSTSDESFVDYLLSLNIEHKYDLIVVLGAPAVAFAQRHRQRLFPATPMVFAAVDIGRIQYPVGPNDALVPVQRDIPGFIDNVLHLLPATKELAVVIGASPLERSTLELMRKHAASFESRVNFIWYNDLSLEDILKHVAALPPHAAVIWITMNVDAAGTVYEGDTAFKRVRAAANAPIFSYQGFLFGRGIVGGPMYSVEAQSQQTASVAIRLLEGGRPADSDLRPMGFAPPRFDWRELQRWGIREHFLPPGSQIDFREPTAWQQYRWHILALIAVMSFQACLIGWLTYEHRRRSVAETESRNAITKLAHMNRIATAGELSASIAHEVNQPLCGITARASAALNWLEAEKPDLDRVRKALAQILKSGDRAGEIVASVRAMFTKGPANQVRIDINKLVQAVLAIVRGELQDNGVTVLLELDGDLPAIKGDHVQLQQVILNLVVNAIEAMHSGQLRMLRIRTELSTPDAIHVAIEDTGTGIDPANTNRVFKALFTTKPAGMGIGLAICRSIITSHGGQIWVSSGTGRGSIFHFKLPVAPLPTASRPAHFSTE